MTKKHPSKKDSDAILIPPPGYDKILSDLKDLIKTSQFKAISAVNQALIFTYRGIGQTIHEQQQSAGWGTSIVEQLAKDLQHSFPGMRGRRFKLEVHKMLKKRIGR